MIMCKKKKKSWCGVNTATPLYGGVTEVKSIEGAF